MISYIKSNPVTAIISFVLVLAFGITTYLLISANRSERQANRQLRREKNELHEENKQLASKVNDLTERVRVREIGDSLQAIKNDSINAKLKKLKPKLANEILTLTDSSDIVFWTRYLAQIDSL